MKQKCRLQRSIKKIVKILVTDSFSIRNRADTGTKQTTKQTKTKKKQTKQTNKQKGNKCGSFLSSSKR